MKREIYNKTTKEKLSLSYYLVKTEIENKDEGFSIETYGVEIEEIINLNDLDNEGMEKDIPYRYIYEISTITDIATDKNAIYDFLKLLFKKSIQPFNLREEVIKWLG